MFDGFLNSISDRLAAEAVFLAGAVGIFGSVAARLLLVVPPISHRSGRLAFFHSLPVACAAIVMILMNQPELAFKVVLGSSVAMMAGVAGFILISSESIDPEPNRKNIWIFAFVPALILFLMGLRDGLDEIDALILLTMGTLILSSWKPSQPDQNLMNLPPAKPFRLALSIGALGLCCLGALLAVHGGVELQNLDRNFSLAAMGPTLLSIALGFPLIGPGIRLAHEKKNRRGARRDSRLVFYQCPSGASDFDPGLQVSHSNHRPGVPAHARDDAVGCGSAVPPLGVAD